MADVKKLVIGLGNPGDRYMNYRCNIGFKAVDVFANNMCIHIKIKKKKSLFGDGDFEGSRIVLLKPQTFMNLSGEAVLYIASFLKISVQDIVVVHDDYTLKHGEVVVSKEVDISHIGINSIAKELKSNKFIKIRIGVGLVPSITEKPTPEEVNKHLNSNFSQKEIKKIMDILNDAQASLRSILTQDINDVLTRYTLESKFKEPTPLKL